MAEEIKNEAELQPKKKNKKGIVAGVIVAIVLVAGIGFWAWHNTPSFCGTMCHSTMSEHLANYEGTDASNGAGLAHVHATTNSAACLDCHEADLNSQIAEAGAQLSGSYDKEGLALGAKYYVDNDKCIECHGTMADMAKKTESLGVYNPHDSIHGNIEYCGECHKGHKAQVDICGECHPNGGQTMRG